MLTAAGSADRGWRRRSRRREDPRQNDRRDSPVGIGESGFVDHEGDAALGDIARHDVEVDAVAAHESPCCCPNGRQATPMRGAKLFRSLWMRVLPGSPSGSGLHDVHVPFGHKRAHLAIATHPGPRSCRCRCRTSSCGRAPLSRPDDTRNACRSSASGCGLTLKSSGRRSRTDNAVGPPQRGKRARGRGRDAEQEIRVRLAR